MSYRYVPGYCVPLYQCNELRYSRDFNTLRRSLCGFYGNDPKVCCPGQSNAGNGGSNPNYPGGGNPNYPGGGNPSYPGGNNNPNSGGNTDPNRENPSTGNSGNDYSTPASNDNYANENLDFTYPRRLPQR